MAEERRLFLSRWRALARLTFSTVTGNGPLEGEVWYVAPLPKGAR